MTDGGALFGLKDGLLLLFVLMDGKVVVGDRTLSLMVLRWPMVGLGALCKTVNKVERDVPVSDVPVNEQMG